ncbi:MAG: asparagine synthase-related protein [Vicinamibacterales bacterium]
MARPSGTAQPALHTTGWVITVERDERGRVTLSSGLPCAQRGALQVFFDGLLFDRARIARAVDAPPDAPPAELILRLVERKGAAAFSELRGSFVVGLVDETANTVRVARDPLGSHPLFYATPGGRAMFASTPQPLLATGDISHSLNRAALADHLAKRWPERQETFFDAIRRVPPGWEVIVSRSGVEASRYWHPVSAEIDYLPETDVAAFDQHLDRAVERGLAAGRTGVFLSGGFDSVSVAAVAADRARQLDLPTPWGLSLGFPDPSCDERLVQTSVASKLGMPMHLVDFREAVGPRGLLAQAIDLNAGLAAPLFNTWAPAYLSLIRHARAHGVDTILTGEGGDEWLGVTPFLAADLLRRGQLRAMLRMAAVNQRSYSQGWLLALGTTMWRYGARPLAGAALHGLAPRAWNAHRARKMVGAAADWLAPDPALRQLQYQRALHSLAPANPVGGFYSRESQLFLDHPLTSWIFEEQHQFGQRLGVRYIHPYWDADLLVHVYRTPPERLNQGGRSKGLVRDTVARRFPSLGFERQRKVTALNFFSSLVTAEAPAIGEKFGDFHALASLGVVDPKLARAFMQRAWYEGPRQLGYAWNLVNLEAWVRQQIS